MNKFNLHFVYNKKQRNGVFYFAVLLVLLQGLYLGISYNINEVMIPEKEINRLNRKIDSIKALPKPIRRIYKFNPNFITDEKGYMLGLSVEEIDRLLEFRKSGQWIKTTKHFQEVTLISDSLSAKLAQRFEFPDYKRTKVKDEQKIVKRKPIRKQGINSATFRELQEINGVGVVLSKRILKYKDLLGGYSDINQLTEVYGLSEDVVDRLKEKYQIINRPVIVKRDINSSSFKEIMAIVYLDYEMTKMLFDYKNKVEKIENLEEIKKIEGFPIEKYDRIALYLQAE